jgi:hypothetical protein
LSELSQAAGDLRAVITPPASGDAAGPRLDDALAQVRHLYSGPAVAAGNAVVEIPAPPDPFEITGAASANAFPASASPAGDARTGTPGAGFTPSSYVPSQAMTSAAGLGEDPRQRLDTPLPVSSDPLRRIPAHGTAVSSPADNFVPTRSDVSPTVAGPAAPGASTAISPAAVARTSPSSMSPFLGAAYPPHMGRDDGGEHRTPSYLISAGNSNELIGQLPLVAPPVIGE